MARAWTAVEYNFKSDITFYDVPENKNSKLKTEHYVNLILKTVMKPWIRADHDFVLKKDRDSNHGIGEHITGVAKLMND